LIGENVLEKRDEEAVTLCGRRAAARLKAENPLNAMKNHPWSFVEHGPVPRNYRCTLMKTTLSVNGFPRRACPSIRSKKLKRSEV
jgi:hypothetical protein